MSLDHSRRNLLKFAPATVALLSMARGVLAQNPPPQGQATSDPTGAKAPSGSGGHGGMPPGPAERDGDFNSGKLSGMHDRDHSEPPAKPRKDLAADQKSMRGEVQQLVRETQELKKALEEFGTAQRLSPDIVGKTKEIERLAHDIAALAKG